LEKIVISDLKLGILGGGQLGKMLALAASSWDVKTYILDEGEDMPAAKVCYEFRQGNFKDYETAYDFGKNLDLLTVEIESVNIEALEALEQQGLRVYPSSAVLKIIQDKGLQNEFLASNGFPKSKFSLYESKDAVLRALNAGEIKLPFVQKLRRFGYDGRGVKVIREKKDLEHLFEEPSLVEECVNISKEISVMAARNERGEVVVYPPVEMVFNPKANLLEYLFCPAALEPSLSNEAENLAKRIIEKLGLVGVLAVELFLDHDNRLWVNELAPRPHNSGHHTIESCITSQYEQHLRGIFNFPLGSTKLKMPSVMVNLLGEAGYQGPVRYEGLTECMAIEGVKIHIYGKKETRPFRKMGHVTILDHDLARAKAKAQNVLKKLKVVA